MDKNEKAAVAQMKGIARGLASCSRVPRSVFPAATFSSQPSSISSGGDASSVVAKAEFVNKRAIYQKQLTELRKGWSAEIEEKKARAEEEKKAAFEKLVLRKAIKLREKRQDSVVRQAADKESKKKYIERFNAHLARNQVIHEQRLVEQQQRNNR